jgi:hypothetical protein
MDETNTKLLGGIKRGSHQMEEKKSKFLTELKDHLKPGCDNVWIIDEPLRYQSALLGCIVEVPKDFEHDYDSVPRWLPWVYAFLKGRARREMVIHDYLCRTDSVPTIKSYMLANRVALEAMTARGKPAQVKYLYFIGIGLGGWACFHRKKVEDKLCDSK